MHRPHITRKSNEKLQLPPLKPLKHPHMVDGIRKITQPLNEKVLRILRLLPHPPIIIFSNRFILHLRYMHSIHGHSIHPHPTTNPPLHTHPHLLTPPSPIPIPNNDSTLHVHHAMVEHIRRHIHTTFHIRHWLLFTTQQLECMHLTLHLTL